MSNADAARWDERYRQGTGPHGGRAARRLAPYVALIDQTAAALTAAGRVPTALDLACGAGGVVVWLALRGWMVTGVDASAVALELADQAVKAAGPLAGCALVQADLDEWRPRPEQVDLLTCFFYLNRALWPAMRQAVRPGGLLIMESFSRQRLLTRPESNPDFLLAEGELVALVTEWGWEVAVDRGQSAGHSQPTDGVVARRPLSM